MLRPSCCRWHTDKLQEPGAGTGALLEPSSGWVWPEPLLVPRLPLLHGQPGSLCSDALSDTLPVWQCWEEN